MATTNMAEDALLGALINRWWYIRRTTDFALATHGLSNLNPKKIGPNIFDL